MSLIATCSTCGERIIIGRMFQKRAKIGPYILIYMDRIMGCCERPNYWTFRGRIGRPKNPRRMKKLEENRLIAYLL